MPTISIKLRRISTINGSQLIKSAYHWIPVADSWLVEYSDMSEIAGLVISYIIANNIATNGTPNAKLSHL